MSMKRQLFIIFCLVCIAGACSYAFRDSHSLVLTLLGGCGMALELPGALVLAGLSILTGRNSVHDGGPEWVAILISLTVYMAGWPIVSHHFWGTRSKSS